MKRNRNGGDQTQAKDNRTPSQVRKEKWADRMLELYLQGNAQHEVAKIMETETGGHRFSKNTVSKVVNTALEHWKQEKADMVAEHKVIELQKINKLEFEAWQAWTRSCLPVKSVSERKKKDEESGRMKIADARHDTRPSAGDPRFFATIQWCVEMRCKLLGMEVPQVQVNVQTNVQEGNTTNTTIIQRRVVFRTRETSGVTQEITEKAEA